MTAFGDMVLTFNDPIKILENYSNKSLFNDSVLTMRIIPEYDFDVNPNDLEFNWTCTNFTET